jgi:eukaryotic-like serine/threonine-protein kinase
MMPSAAPSPLPLRISRYALLDRIGGNSTSTVYRAFDDTAQQYVAVKMIAADLQDDGEARERFYREVKVTAGLSHRNIVSVLDFGEEDGRPFLVMELLSGQPLAQRVRAGAVSLEEAVSMTRQLCAGLQAAHDLAIVHRDIKPSNLFVTDGGVLKILDFGLARLQASTLTANGSIVGTPEFMAPEQAEGRRVDHRADIFSAGAVSARLITGVSPFARPDLRQTLDALLNGSPAGLDAAHVTPAIRAVLLRALAIVPADRYQTAAEFADAIAAAHLVAPAVKAVRS